MLIGYMRVSKADGSQTTDLQRDALLAAGVAENALYEDRASGARDDRQGLAACLKALRPGDTLLVWKLDRLGRSMRHLITTVMDLAERGVGFRSLTDARIDTTTAAGKFLLAIFAALAELERDQIKRRTEEGMKAARARGREGGRPPGMTPGQLRVAAAAMANNKTKVRELARELGVSHVTLYNNIRPDGSLTERGERLLARGR